MINVKEIIKNYLKEHGYDGLWSDQGDYCGCQVDDLCPCDEPNLYGCVAAHMRDDNLLYPRKECGPLES
jgi:hypothetical protein